MPAPDGRHAALVLGASVVIICVGVGTLFALSVFLLPITEATAWTRGDISVVASLNWISLGVGSLVMGYLSDRFGTRLVVAIGGLVLGLALVLSSQATSLPWFDVTFGVMVGLGAGSFYVPLSSTASKWFTANRGLALAVISSGMGLGTFIAAPVSRWLIDLYGWRIAMLLIGDVAWLVVVPLALLLRDPPGPTGARERVGTRAAPEFPASRIVRTPAFWAIAIAHFACCAAHSGPIFHMVTHVADQGIGKMAAATVFGVSGFASIGGRIACGMLADRFGAKPTLVVGLGVQAAAIAAYLVVRDLGAFYALAVVFGVAYGGVMPLYAFVTREYFGEKAMGTAFGGVFMISCLGMGLGSFAGGWFYDHLGSYAWLFASSVAFGAVAALVAMSCPPRRLAARGAAG